MGDPQRDAQQKTMLGVGLLKLDLSQRVRWLPTRNETILHCRDVSMTGDNTNAGLTMDEERELTHEEYEAYRRETLFVEREEATPDQFPRLWNLSAAFLYRGVIRADVPEPPEYVTVPMPNSGMDELCNAITRWNVLWEAAQFRRRFFGKDDLPKELGQVAESGDTNVVFVPRTQTRYYEYAPLVHLLPREQIERHGLPLLRGGQWPFFADSGGIDPYFPHDFEQRLSRAWASTVWRHMNPRSPMSGFTGSDPIRLLAHNLDFWVPAVTEVIQQTLRGLPVVDNGVDESPPPLVDGGFLEGATTANPRVGTDLWRGEAEAADVVALTVEQADSTGRLRGILDAVRSHRVEDDFSQRWTREREDFERKLYRKRDKIKVRFVELPDTIPVQGPETEVEDRIVYGDFLALLDERDRQIVVVLHSGVTKLTDVAKILGYANHSPVSKRLARIRRLAEEHFDR
ncbi:MAG: sigma-70 family RNA polymerase sigma factor [Actinomycetes bacterium]